MQILLAVDGSIYTRRMLAYLAEQSQLIGSEPEITAFTAVTSISAYASRFTDVHAVEAYYKEAADQVLAPIQAFADQHGWMLKLRHSAGYPPDVIAAYANAHQPSMIVMGTHGDTELTNRVSGSVVTEVFCI